jgi:hypothetical protein
MSLEARTRNCFHSGHVDFFHCQLATFHIYVCLPWILIGTLKSEKNHYTPGQARVGSGGVGRHRRAHRKIFWHRNFFPCSHGEVFPAQLGPGTQENEFGRQKGANSSGQNSSLASIPREGHKLTVGRSFSRKRRLGRAPDSTLWFSGLGLKPKVSLSLRG